MISAAVYQRIRKLPRRDRIHALMLMSMKPVRLLGGCLECGEDAHGARVGIYVPQDGSPVQQVVVYEFCRDHAAAAGRLSAAELEQLVTLAHAGRPHIPEIDPAGSRGEDHG